MVAYDEHHGVRSLLGFKDANNDYEYEVYAWNAMKSTYTRARDLKGGDQ